MTSATTAPTARMCPSSGEIIHEDRTDGNGIVTCPGCSRFRATETVPTDRRLRRIETHVRPPVKRWRYVYQGWKYGVFVPDADRIIGEVYKDGSTWTAVPTWEPLQVASHGHTDRWAAATWLYADWCARHNEGS